jgi:hypothetical protein
VEFGANQRPSGLANAEYNLVEELNDEQSEDKDRRTAKGLNERGCGSTAHVNFSFGYRAMIA